MGAQQGRRYSHVRATPHLPNHAGADDHCRTSSTKAHMQEYLDVADLRTLLISFSLCSCIHQRIAATLTDGEIAAIDEAGKDGPPSELRVFLYHLRRHWKPLLFFLCVYMFFWGPALFARLVGAGCSGRMQV